MIELLKKLCCLDGPSGNEEKICEYIKHYVSPYAEEIVEDAMGNLMVFVRGKKSISKKIMLSAHMDEVGFIVKDITDEGVIKFGFVGGIDPRVVIGRRVRFGKTLGVVGIKAVHLTTLSERKTVPKISDLYIDIGASSKSDAESKLSLGDYGTFDSECIEFGDTLLKSKAIDDRLGCAVMMRIIKEKPAVDTWFAFNVQEEVGLRGAQPSTFRIKPDIAMVIEGTTASDIENVPKHKRVCAVRNGVVIPFMDRGTIYNQELFNILRLVAEENSIKWQTKHMVAGGTDAGKIHQSRCGVKTVAVAAPVRYIHSPSSVVSVDDVEAVYKLSKLFLEEMGEKYNV